jgi:hypothetical protein
VTYALWCGRSTVLTPTAATASGPLSSLLNSNNVNIQKKKKQPSLRHYNNNNY